MKTSSASGGVDRRIFVVGVPRSGTTLLQSLLAAHDSLTSFTESHFFDRHFVRLPLFGKVILRRDPCPRVQEFLSENREAPSPSSDRMMADPGAGWRLPLRTRSIGCALLRILDEIALRRGRSAWIEKTPRHLHYLDFIEGLAASGREPDFVHVIRDGLEVVASLSVASQSWERPYDLAACAARWNADVASSWHRRSSPRDHFVFYEDLTADPEATLRALLDDLGLQWQENLLEAYGMASEGLVTPEESAWKAGVARAIRPSATSGRAFSDALRDEVSRSLRTEFHDRLRAHVIASGKGSEGLASKSGSSP